MPKPREAEKRCPGCKKTLPVAEFPRNAALVAGRGIYCRACKRASDRRRRRGGAEQAAPLVSKPGEKLPTRKRFGRPSTLTPEVIAAICEPLRQGHSRRVSARVAGVNEDMLANWMMRGRDAKDETAPTRQLYHAVLEAEGVGLSTLETRALAGADVDHVQALRLLERRDPETWGRHQAKAASDAEPRMDLDDLRKLLAERLARFLPETVAASTPAGDSAAVAGGEPG